MDPARKRMIRLVVSLGVAMLLAVGLIYTSFSASTEAKEPSQLRGATPGQTYDLTGRVVKGTVKRNGSRLRFQVADRDDPSARIAVTYNGTVPDPFRAGREIVLTGVVENGVFVGEPDTLITKCPSKFTNADAG